MLLALDMGLGKTKIGLDFAGSMLFHRKIGRVLVMAPLSALSVWEDEIEKNWDDSLGLVYATLRPESSALWKNAQLILTNYDYAKRIISELMEWAPDLVILDESHKIKNPYARQSKISHRLGAICTYAVCLTGTPIGNRPFDLWSQFRFLVPDLLDDTFKNFKNRYAAGWTKGGYEVNKYRDMKGLAKLVAPYVKSAKKEDYLDLPPKNFIEVPVEMGERGRKLYKSMEKDFVAAVNESTSIVAPIVLAKLTKLSQISGGFIRDTEEQKDHVIHRSKLEVLDGICDDLKDAGTERVVIFARFIWEIKEIQKLLAPSWVTYIISGDVDMNQRKLAQTMFNASGGAMICQTQTGSGSLNLQAANYVIYYSLDYSYLNFAQSQDRIHRSGQTKPCFYYVLLSKGTLDRRIYKILESKRNVADDMMSLVKEVQERK